MYSVIVTNIKPTETAVVNWA